MKISIGEKGRIVHIEMEPEFVDNFTLSAGDTKHHVGRPWWDASVGTHYPLQALTLALPLERTFISNDGRLYVLPSDSIGTEEITWGSGEHQVKLRKWKPKVENQKGP